MRCSFVENKERCLTYKFIFIYACFVLVCFHWILFICHTVHKYIHMYNFNFINVYILSIDFDYFYKCLKSLCGFSPWKSDNVILLTKFVKFQDFIETKAWHIFFVSHWSFWWDQLILIQISGRKDDVRYNMREKTCSITI